MNRVILLSLFMTFLACTEKKDSSVVTKSTAPKSFPKPVEKPIYSTFQNWLTYYQTENPDFAKEKFTLNETSPITYNPSNIIVMNQKGFNEVYKPFFVFNQSKTAYLDFDSYHWILGKDGSASFEADQEIALVDLKTKMAKQIAFFGPSYRIEEAYWKGDSTAVLLGNTYEKVPFILSFNFVKNTKQHFQYSDTLKFEKPYSEVRMQKFGISTQ